MPAVAGIREVQGWPPRRRDSYQPSFHPPRSVGCRIAGRFPYYPASAGCSEQRERSPGRSRCAFGDDQGGDATATTLTPLPDKPGRRPKCTRDTLGSGPLRCGPLDTKLRRPGRAAAKRLESALTFSTCRGIMRSRACRGHRSRSEQGGGEENQVVKVRHLISLSTDT